ncbi:MAG: 4Fe-4S binding protein [Promethearchaeota archaeon]
MLQEQMTESKNTPRYKIKIDKKLCGDPIECGLKCVKSCPYNILAYCQRKKPKSGEAPQKFKIISAFHILCNNCKRCINACPKNAIQIKL